MYEYIKGKKVQLEEHMLSASELAGAYGLYTQSGQPHGLMVAAILREYEFKTNLNISEYYYSHGHGVMRVYPEILWKPAMGKFIFENNLDVDDSENKRILKVLSENKNFVYFHPSPNVKPKKIISITERRQQNGK